MDKAACKKLFDLEDSTYLNYLIMSYFQSQSLKTYFGKL